MSTATDVREAIRDAIRGIETTLGFADSDYSQIHEYLLDHETPEKRTAYLKGALAAGSKTTRAIGIEVLESESHDQLWADVVNRIYQITIEFYYNVGANGSGVQLLISHMRAVRSVIRGMSTELSGTVNRVSNIQQTRPRLVPTEVDATERERILTAAIQMEAFETNATF